MTALIVAALVAIPTSTAFASASANTHKLPKDVCTLVGDALVAASRRAPEGGPHDRAERGLRLARPV